MLKKYLIIFLLTTTCKQHPEVILYPGYKQRSKEPCPVQVWYNIEGVEYSKCYR